MSEPAAAVLDTNVLLDLWLFRDPVVEPLRTALAAGVVRAFRSPATDAEFAEVLGRPELFSIAPDRQALLLEQWQAAATPAEATRSAPWVCRDPLDQKFLDLAVSVRAGWLITKDRDLLKLARKARREGLLIVTPENWAEAHAGRICHLSAGTTTPPDMLSSVLEELGASALMHFNRTLDQHLRGTEALLRKWGARDAVCIAGLLHAVYGTDTPGPMLAHIDQRRRIAGVTGAEAEQLAYLYGACNRKAFYPRLRIGQLPLFPDRFTGTEYAISEATLADLCEITVANELELLAHRPTFRSARQRSRLRLFHQVESFLSPAARDAFRSSPAVRPDPGSL